MQYELSVTLLRLGFRDIGLCRRVIRPRLKNGGLVDLRIEHGDEFTFLHRRVEVGVDFHDSPAYLRTHLNRDLRLQSATCGDFPHHALSLDGLRFVVDFDDFSGRLPTLKAQSSVASSTQSSGTAPRTTWNIQAVLTVPIWDGGARYGSLRQARVSRDEAAYSLESNRRSINVEVEQARRGVQVAEQALAVARTAVDLATRNDELTRTAYQLGKGTTSFELVAAAQALQQVQIQLAVKEFGVVGARLSALLTMANCSE